MLEGASRVFEGVFPRSGRNIVQAPVASLLAGQQKSAGRFQVQGPRSLLASRRKTQGVFRLYRTFSVARKETDLPGSLTAHGQAVGEPRLAGPAAG